MYDDVYISIKGKGLTKTLSLVIGHILILIDILSPSLYLSTHLILFLSLNCKPLFKIQDAFIIFFLNITLIDITNLS